uniref:Anaphase-promoting complex subunit 5 n=1 Tax=Strigamia maritima TaxID=126957 RepID=T1IR26_STRMM
MSSLDVLSTLAAISGKKQIKENFTSHKISLLIMINEYCFQIGKRKSEPQKDYDGNAERFPKQQMRNIALNILRFIQGPDIELPELLKILQSNISPKFHETFKERLSEIYNQSLAGFIEYIQSVEILMVEPTPTVPIVHKSSVIGLFLRRMLLAFDKLSFSQVYKLHANFELYYQASLPESDDFHMDFNDTEQLRFESEKSKCRFSRKQAEYFISQQAAMIQSNEKEALPPDHLQDRIREILNYHPDLAEAHFLSYLNNIRVKEYCGAINHLYHCFDRNTLSNQDSKSCADDVGRSFRYAALNLAALHCRFGHKEEALAALREAITLAQETNDNFCLQHALSWLYRLEKDGREELLERSITKTGDLSLSYLTSLGIQSFAQHKAILATQPSEIFEFMMKSDILNCQHSMLELMANSFAQKAALWRTYGKNFMTNLSSQILLHLNTADPMRKGLFHSGEGICLALCNVAVCLIQQGQVKQSREILQHAETRFPSQSQYSHIWIFTQQLIDFDEAIKHGNWHEAEVAVQNMAVVNPTESNLRLAQMYLYRGDFANASKVITKLLDDDSREKETPEFQARTFILQSELHVLSRNYSAALTPLMHGLTICNEYHLDYLTCLFTLHIANVQLLLGISSQALTLLNQVMVSVLTNGSVLDRARANFLYAKCIMAQASKQEKEIRQNAWFAAIGIISNAIDDFNKIEAYDRVRDAMHIQARVYNELGFIAERNKCALNFRQLNEQYESTFQPRTQLL